MRLGTAPHYRYQLKVDVEPTERETITSALEDEPFELGERIGLGKIMQQIEDGALDVEASSETQLTRFESDVEVLSVYLPQYIIGKEVYVRPTAGAPILVGWMIVGRSGQVVRLALDVRWDATAEQIVDGGPDVDAIVARWTELPEWVRDAMRISHPRLRSL
jgi:hypothetical protein